MPDFVDVYSAANSLPTVTYRSDSDVVHWRTIGSDADVAIAAWASTDIENAVKRSVDNPDDVAKLIPYLVKHRHGTPFEHNMLSFIIRAPIFDWREHHRHRIGWSYNEESARYSKLKPEFFVPSIDRPLFKVDNWKPGKPKFLTVEEEFERLATLYHGANKIPTEQLPHLRYERLCSNLKASYRIAYSLYEDNLDLNVDPGCARDNLPVGIYSTCVCTCNARSLMNFLSLRIYDEFATWPSYALAEIQEIARKMEAVFAEHFPITHKAFVDNGRVAP